MSLSARVQPQCRHILQSSWCARPMCMQQPYRPGMTCLKETLGMKDNYDKICSENQRLNTLLNRQQKDKEKRRARDEALKEARDKARVEEEERQAVRDKCDKRQRQDMQFAVL